MRHESRNRGIGRMETLLALIVVVSAGAILILITTSSKSKNLLLDESGRMRKVYVALSLYEEQYDAHPAPSLVAASLYDPIHSDYLSQLDPFSTMKSASYPNDPGLDNRETAPFRISFSYLQNYCRAGKLEIKPWAESHLNPALGVLADEWFGDVKAEQPFHAQVGGKLMRINTDGSVFVYQRHDGMKPLGDPEDMFLKR